MIAELNWSKGVIDEIIDSFSKTLKSDTAKYCLNINNENKIFTNKAFWKNYFIEVLFPIVAGIVIFGFTYIITIYLIFDFIFYIANILFVIIFISILGSLLNIPVRLYRSPKFIIVNNDRINIKNIFGRSIMIYDSQNIYNVAILHSEQNEMLLFTYNNKNEQKGITFLAETYDEKGVFKLFNNELIKKNSNITINNETL